VGAWGGVNEMRDRVGLPVGQCFFMNFLPGLRLVEDCYSFLNLQISLFQPRAVFLLGKFCAHQAIKRWSVPPNSSNSIILSSWETDEKRISTPEEIDASGKAVGSFATGDGRNIKYAFLTHPANRRAKYWQTRL
jgi:uracil-DNA glycosylase